MRKINWKASLSLITDGLSAIGSRSQTATAIAFLLLSAWLASKYGPEPEPTEKAKTGKVDYYARGLRRTVMGDDGKPKEFLIAKEMVHYEEEDSAELFRPVITLYSKEGPPWVIHSETATIPGKSEFVFLNGEVLILREADQTGRTMRIETSNIRTIPGKDYAETDEYIRLISPPDYMTGTGATINFGKDLTYKILKDVRRRHDVEAESSE